MLELPPGTFYLGERLSPEPTPLFYPAHHLTTHGVILGMTGSGKTGLGIVLLEEALLRGIPVIALDVKGDLGNLLLSFPELGADDFEPWVDAGEAQRRGLSTAALAGEAATAWRDGLARSEIGPERISALRDAADLAIYTPGSEAGRPLNILGSLSAPPGDFDDDAEGRRDEIEGIVLSLLALAGITADPIADPAPILLAHLLERAWREGTDLDLAQLILQVHKPPLRKLGVFELDSFFPEAERRKLAMRLNGLLASPGFGAWLAGEPLAIDTLMSGPDGRPRASVLYLGHLSEQERSMVITLVLAKVATWMRRQSGTSALRGLVFVDEVFGLIPPTAQPPTKKPILTLLKQARAFGVGLVVATQNPVDLDYKAMSNAGTWMVGRLQTERDKARILEGLESAGGASLPELDRLLSNLEQRQWVLHDTRGDGPLLFSTRWAMSYLRGPLTKEEVRRLTAAADATPTPAAAEPTRAQTSAPPAPPAPAPADDESAAMPQIAAGTPVYFLDPGAPWATEVGADPGTARWEAALVARVALRFDDTRAGIDHREEWEAVLFPLAAELDPAAARAVDYDDRDLRREAPDGIRYVLPLAPLDDAKRLARFGKQLSEQLYRGRQIEVWRNPELKLYSRVGESEAAFAARCDRAAQERADAEGVKLKARLQKKIDRVGDQLRQAERRVRELEVNVQGRKQQEVVAGAGALLSMFLGGRGGVRSLSGAASRRSTTLRTEQRLQSAREKVGDKGDELEALEDELAAALVAIDDEWRSAAEAIEPLEIGLEKNDVDLIELAVVWIPRA